MTVKEARAELEPTIRRVTWECPGAQWGYAVRRLHPDVTFDEINSGVSCRQIIEWRPYWGSREHAWTLQLCLFGGPEWDDYAVPPAAYADQVNWTLSFLYALAHPPSFAPTPPPRYDTPARITAACIAGGTPEARKTWAAVRATDFAKLYKAFRQAISLAQWDTLTPPPAPKPKRQRKAVPA